MSQLIDLLNQALEDEYQASMQYNQHYNNVRSKHTDVIDHFKEHMGDENGHAAELAMRIYTLGGTPSIGLSPLAAYTDDIDEALKQDIIAEQKAIDLYSEIIDVCEQEGDKATQMMVEGILADEVKHLDEFAKFRRSTVSRSGAKTTPEESVNNFQDQLKEELGQDEVGETPEDPNADITA